MNRRLYRCDHDRKIAGVAGGIAEYFDMDVSIVRILWVASIFFGGFGILLYIVMALIVPLEPVGPRPGPLWGATAPDGTAAGEPGTEPATGSVPAGWPPAPHRHARRGSGMGMTFVGIALILFGGLALVDAYLPSWADQGRFLWPAFILGMGVLLVVASMRRTEKEKEA